MKTLHLTFAVLLSGCAYAQTFWDEEAMRTLEMPLATPEVTL